MKIYSVYSNWTSATIFFSFKPRKKDLKYVADSVFELDYEDFDKEYKDMFSIEETWVNMNKDLNYSC